ncbi:MAG TPA: molybdopterin cofactor-binding domain-containing protein, partial [Burkholderiales bacterium]|nr:molybdopterin cofactor-binding domain-containing protein [Burkholderiales bacterium]
MNTSTARRNFLKTAGAITVGFSWSIPSVLAQQAARPSLPGSLNTSRMLDGWVRINANGTVTVFTGKCELGQGILTALAQIAADELDVSYERIEMVSADTARTPNEGMTAGSLSVENSGTAVRMACAEARQIVLELAAKKLGVPVANLSVSDGTITGSAKVTYWDLAAEANLKREASGQVKPKPHAQHKVVGKSIPRRDIPPKITGGRSYVQDVRMPGMVYGRVVRPPSYRAQLVSFDENRIKGMPGVVAVARDGSFLAVAAEREEQAIKAAQALRASAKWTEAADLPPSGPALYDHLQRMPAQDIVVNQKVPAAPAGGKIVSHEHTYRRPFQAHASMAPSCAVAQFKDGKYAVWTHSQGVFPLRGELVKILKVPAADITCTHVEGAGCYGHNGADDVALDAALLARATGGRPVKLQWMREDEFGWEPYGSAMVMKMRARVDESGNVVDWQHEVWSHPHSTRPASTSGGNVLAGWHIANPVPMGVPANSPQPSGAADRNAVPLYEFPSQKVLLHYVTDMPIRTSALRGLGAYANVFALESFIDELAAAAGADPVEYRLRHMKDPRARAVIETCAEKAGWKPGQKGDGTRGRGIAFAKYKNLASYCA